MGYSASYTGTLKIPARIYADLASAAAVDVAAALESVEWTEETEHSDDIDVTVTVCGQTKMAGQENQFSAAAKQGLTGEIEFRGEDDSLWKWVLADGDLREHSGRVTYDPERPAEERIVTIDDVRGEAAADPHLSQAEADRLRAASDDEISAALNTAWWAFQDQFWAVHDGIQGTAKALLLVNVVTDPT